MMKHTNKILAALCLLVAVCALNSRNAYAVCTSPASDAGAIIYSSSTHTFQYCKDNVWSAMNLQPGSGSGGCTSPTVSDGQMIYNTDRRTLQGCAGNVHRPFGPDGGANKWLQVSSKGNHSCGIRDDRSLWCWGTSARSQLGNNRSEENDFEPAPIAISGGGTWKAVDVGANGGGYGHTCGLKTDNTAWCWGQGDGGQNGDGNASYTDGAPVAVAGGQSWIMISTGNQHACAIRADNTAWCWGRNDSGRLGNGNTTQQNTPSLVTTTGVLTWKSISTFENNTCGIKTDDTLWCWGIRDWGRIGDGGATTGNQLTPVLVSGGFTWKSVSVGLNATCAIRSNDAAYCWGEGSGGERGGGNNTATQNTPAIVSGGYSWKYIGMGYYHGCGVRTNGTAMCWGAGWSGQIGDGTLNSSNVPVSVSGGFSWQTIHAGVVTACGLKTDGAVMCWGENDNGELGHNMSEKQHAPETPVQGGGIWTAITGSGFGSCVIRNDQTLWCWGDGGSGQNGISQNSYTPLQVINGGTWLKADTSPYYAHTCGIKTDNTAWCWGEESNGELGNGATGGGPTPSAVNGGYTWKEIATGFDHTCAIRSDDNLWCWGDDGSGRLGNGAGGNSTAPVAVSTGGVQTWKSISLGGDYSCGIKTDDSGWCWGEAQYGQLGTGNTTDQQTPTAISTTGTLTWSKVIAGNSATCGIKTDGTAWCWGSNWQGGVGDGTTTQRDNPVQVSGGGTWIDVDTYDGHSCGIKTDGTAWCWGMGVAGELGTGQKIYTPTLTPVAVASDGIAWSMIEVMFGATCGLKVSNEAYCWGNGTWSGFAQRANSLVPAAMACAAPVGSAGSIKYNSTTNILQYCDGAGWTAINDGVRTAYVPPDLPSSGLVAYWAFDEGAGTTANDSSGNANTGTLTNGPTWTTGRVGTAVNLDGANDYVTAGSAAILDDMPTFSVCAWVYPTGNGNGSFPGIVDKSHNGGFDGWNFYLVDNATPKDFGFFQNYDSYREAGGADRVQLNEWTHLCGTWAGGNAASSIQLYRNGVLITSFSLEGTFNSYSSDAADNLLIGMTGTHNFEGLIDEVRIYNRALTLTEVQSLAAQ